VPINNSDTENNNNLFAGKLIYMTTYQNICIENALEIIDKDNCIIIDIRDIKSYNEGRLPGAKRFEEREILRMRKSSQRHDPVLVYCYHGNSSKDIASLLCTLGFSDVYNLEGGYTAWSAKAINATAPSQKSILDLRVIHWLAAEGFNSGNINASGTSGLTPLMQACRLGLSDIAELLIEAGAEINSTNKDGNNALWLACFSGDLATIHMLIEHKVDMDNMNSAGATALIYASSAGKSDVVELLLKSGANPYIRTQDDFTALDLAATPKAYRSLKAYVATQEMN